MKHLFYSFLIIFCFSSFSYSQGNESFDNMGNFSSYSDGNFLGNNGITWSYIGSRDGNNDSNNSGINLPALMLRRSSSNSKVTSTTISGGIGDFSVKLYKGYTGDGNRQVELLINGVSKGLSVAFDNYDEQLFTVSGINVTGDIVIEIITSTSKQVIIDDIIWTGFVATSEGITLGAVSGNTNEDGTTATFSAVLNTAPTSDVVLDIGSSDTGEVTVNPSQLTFTTANWNSTQLITVNGVDDSEVDGDINVTITVAVNDASSDDDYDGISTSTTVTNENDDFPPVPELIITEVSDPKDEYNGRFVEIYNNGTSSIDLGTEQIYFVKSVNAGSSYSEIALTGTIEPNEVFVISSSDNLNTHYGFYPEVPFNNANGNGDDAYALFYGGGRTTGYLMDVYGELGVDGSSMDWEYEDTRAYRINPKNTSANSTWTSSEWTIGSTDLNLSDMTPGTLENEFRYDGSWKPRDIYTNSLNTDDVYIQSSVDLTANLTVNNFEVNDTATLSINSGSSLIVSGTSTGNVTYNRTIPTDNWYLMSSPVVGETYDDAYVTANSIASGTGPNIGIAPYVTSDDTWNYMQSGETATFAAGNGYSVKRSATGDISFTGTLNTADVSAGTLSTAGNRFNLLGNPYTSHINSATFLANETAVSETQTLWVWNQATGVYEVKIIADAMVIAPAQGFFVKANAAGGTFNFAESNQASSGGTFQRTANRPEIYLSISNQTDAREAKIYYIDNMTTGFDVGYEGELFNGVSNPLAIYTHLVADSEGQNYQVQSLPPNNYENMIVPVGVNAASGSAITIEASTNNFPEGVNIYLEDKSDDSFTLLDSTSVFTTTPDEDLNGIGRFYIHTTATALSDNQVSLTNVSMYLVDRNLTITGVHSGDTNVRVYDLLGKEVHSTSFQGTGFNKITLPSLTTGVYVVQLETQMEAISKKIIIKK